MKYFKLSEFDSPDVKGSGKNMKMEFLLKLDEAREEAGIAFIINSGFRTKEHNLKIGGRIGSSHIKGLACDIHCINSHIRQIIVSSLIKVGFTRIGISQTFVHVDLDKDKKDAIWLY
mgnify:CR=1 FL=1|tara:strand:+ start:2927 stop:3277 length:351 start_codon:yes stop_codon:yes gene_type:complete